MSDLVIHSPQPVRNISREALVRVLAERERQDARWGEQNLSPERWLRILAEETGEAAREMDVPDGLPFPANLENEITQMAAVCLVMLECCLRNDWCGTATA